MPEVTLNGQSTQFRGLGSAWDQAEYAKLTAQDLEFLNNNVLIGFTEQRGKAWHYVEEMQGDEPNHYDGAIPVEDVLRRLFNWQAIEVPLEYEFNGERIVTPNRKLIIASDNGQDLGVFKGSTGAGGTERNGYQIHQRDEWLVENVQNLVDSHMGLGIASASQIKNRAQAFVQIQLEENVNTPEGFTFRPFLGACTSFDGSLATTYKRGLEAWVCANTMRIGLADKSGEVFKVKHTSNSLLKLTNARAALTLIERDAEDSARAIASLAAVDVALADWKAFLDEYTPIPEEKGRAKTIAETKRSELESLYASDDRVAPWAGTALGVLQATNTWNTHYRTVRNASRFERNLTDFVFGKTEEADDEAMKTLDKVTNGRLLQLA